MNTTLKLNKVLDVIEKVTDDGRNYIRVTFDVIDQNEVNQKAKISMSEAQWGDLKIAMGITFNSQLEEIHTATPVSVEFETKGMTKSKNPKLLMESKIGTYKGYSFNYLELNVGILIQNNIVLKETFKKDYGKLF